MDQWTFQVYGLKMKRKRKKKALGGGGMKSATLNDKPTWVVIKYHYNWHDVNNDSTSEKVKWVNCEPYTCGLLKTTC